MKRFLAALLVALFVFTAATPVAVASDVTVYITNTGRCYHRESCSSLRRSKHAISLEDAINGGYRACKRCHPPTE